MENIPYIYCHINACSSCDLTCFEELILREITLHKIFVTWSLCKWTMSKELYKFCLAYLSNKFFKRLPDVWVLPFLLRKTIFLQLHIRKLLKYWWSFVNFQDKTNIVLNFKRLHCWKIMVQKYLLMQKLYSATYLFRFDAKY